MDGVLIYDRHLVKNNFGTAGEVRAYFNVFETQLGMAHIKQDENYPIGG